MAHMRCEGCGRFMRLTDYLPQDDEFDEELAFECGLTDDEYNDAVWDMEGKWSRFRYVQQLWECENCQTEEWHTMGERYYWNPDSGNYDGEKPLTPKERAALENQQQEAAGQGRLL